MSRFDSGVSRFDPNLHRKSARPNVLAYLRVSIHEDRTGSHTFETQSQRIREKLDSLYGSDSYDLEVLTDNGVSGGYGLIPTGVQKRTRPTLRILADKLATKRYNCLIVYNFSRIARSPRWFHQLLEDVIVPSGARFLSATQELNLSSADGRAMAGMMAVMDGFYRDGVIERNKDAAATRAQAGFYVGQVGYGWEWEPEAEVPSHGRRRIRPVAEQVKWIVQMKEWYLAGLTLSRLADKLNTLGISSPSGKSRWTTSVIYGVLHNPVHAGLVPLGRHGKEWLRGEHFEFRCYEAQTLEQLRQAVQERRRWMTNTQHAAHLLGALVRCDRCGKRLYMSAVGTKHRAYRCHTGWAQGGRTCPGVTVRADALEAAVLQEVERLAREPRMRELLSQEAGRATELHTRQLQGEHLQLGERLNTLTLRLERLVDALGDGTLSKAEFGAVNQRLKAEREEIAQRLAETEGALLSRREHEQWGQRVQAAVLDLPKVWEHLTPDERREVLSLVLEKLTVDRVGPNAVVSLKVQLLPERQIIIENASRRKKQKTPGVQALTLRHLAALYHLGRGMRPVEAARVMGIYGSSFSSLVRRAAQVLELPLAQAIEVARPRVAELKHALPLGAPGQSYDHEAEEPVKAAPLLPPAQMELLPLAVRGASLAEMMAATGLRESTVEGRRLRLLHLLGARNVGEVEQKARALGLWNGSAGPESAESGPETGEEREEASKD